ncbi:MAG: hypothetical protein VB137_00005, partial [Burkholderia sp.]
MKEQAIHGRLFNNVEERSCCRRHVQGPIPSGMASRRIGISKRQRRRAICAEVRWTGSGAVGGQGFRQRHAIFA